MYIIFETEYIHILLCESLVGGQMENSKMYNFEKEINGLMKLLHKQQMCFTTPASISNIYLTLMSFLLHIPIDFFFSIFL